MRRSRLLAAVVALIASAGVCIDRPAHAAPTESLILIEADTGKVLFAENAGYPWYPASITKVMTVYLALQAVREGRLRLDTLLTVSANAAAEPPSKMGFKPGTRLTLDNALKMLMVKSANDIAVVVAEGVGGSVPAFAAEMNRTAQRLGMVQSHYVNPHGLPDEGQISSARDIAILARAILRDFPEHRAYFDIPAVRLGKRMMRNYNTLIDRYPGADGMKTGFICASGYNLVASATRQGKRLIAVVFGAYGGAVRAQKAAQLFERGFSSGNLSWLTPSLGTVDALQPVDAAPLDLRDEMCGKHRRKPASEANDEDESAQANANGESVSGDAAGSAQMFSLSAMKPSPEKYILPPATITGPVVTVYTGTARNPTDNAIPVAVKKPKNKKTKSAHAKTDAKTDIKGKSGAKTAAKPASNAKPAEKPAAKPSSKPKKKAAAAQ